MIRLSKAAILLSAVAVLFIAAHMIWPQLEIDSITVALIVLAIVPWLAPVVKSFELPGGVKVTLRELESASSKVIGSPPSAPPASTPDSDLLQIIAASDPNLALAALRINIEGSLRKLASARGIDAKGLRLRTLIRRLHDSGVVPPTISSGLEELVLLGNQAVHGADVAPQGASWALEAGPRILGFLDDMVREAS